MKGLVPTARVLITGTSSGIGRATALELAACGHEVIATARDPKTLEGLPVAARLTLDQTQQDSVETAVAAAGPLDAVIANAGQIVRGSVKATPIEEFERLMNVNFLGALRVTKAVVPQFRERRDGRISLVSSILGRLTLPMVSAYVASKFAIEAVAEALSLETAHLGIKVSAIEPGAVSTDGPANASGFPDSDDDYAPVWASLNSGPSVTADDVARVIADTLELVDPPLRVPAEHPAQAILAALAAAPTDRPFTLPAVQPAT